MPEFCNFDRERICAHCFSAPLVYFIWYILGRLVCVLFVSFDTTSADWSVSCLFHLIQPPQIGLSVVYFVWYNLCRLVCLSACSMKTVLALRMPVLFCLIEIAFFNLSKSPVFQSPSPSFWFWETELSLPSPFFMAVLFPRTSWLFSLVFETQRPWLKVKKDS